MLIKNIPVSYILNKVKYEMIYITIIGMLSYTVLRSFEDVIPPMPNRFPIFSWQDPLSNKPTVTAMTSIASTIGINLKQLIGENNIAVPQPSDKFFIL